MPAVTCVWVCSLSLLSSGAHRALNLSSFFTLPDVPEPCLGACTSWVACRRRFGHSSLCVVLRDAQRGDLFRLCSITAGPAFSLLLYLWAVFFRSLLSSNDPICKINVLMVVVSDSCRPRKSSACTLRSDRLARAERGRRKTFPRPTCWHSKRLLRSVAW